MTNVFLVDVLMYVDIELVPLVRTMLMVNMGDDGNGMSPPC